MAIRRTASSTSRTSTGRTQVRATRQIASFGGGLNLPVGITDVTPGVPAYDVQIVDPRNFVINNMTGRPAKLVPIGAKIQRRRRPRGRGGLSAAKVMDIVREERQNQMPLFLAMMMAGRH